MQITMQRARPAWPSKTKLRMTLDCSRTSEGNRDDEWIFCRRKGADIALFFRETRIRKIGKIFEEN